MLRRLQTPAFAYALTTFLGLVMTGIGVWGLSNGGEALFGGQVVEGEVVELVERPLPDTDGAIGHAPVVQWRTADGSIHRLIGDTSADPPEFSTGDTVKLDFDPENPFATRIHSLRRDLLGPALTTGAGIMLVVLARVKGRKVRGAESKS